MLAATHKADYAGSGAEEHTENPTRQSKRVYQIKVIKQKFLLCIISTELGSSDSTTFILLTLRRLFPKPPPSCFMKPWLRKLWRHGLTVPLFREEGRLGNA